MRSANLKACAGQCIFTDSGGAMEYVSAFLAYHSLPTRMDSSRSATRIVHLRHLALVLNRVHFGFTFFFTHE